MFSKHREVNFFCRRYSKNDDQIFSIIDEIILLDDDEFLSRKMILQNLFKNINFDKSKINLISDQNILCHKFRENNDYKSKFDYFSEFFSFLNTVSNNDTDFFCIARIPTLETILSMVDGAQIQGWNWITDDLEYINLNSENIPKFFISWFKCFN